MKDRIVKTICSQAGESIAETLIALLVSSLALVMLAGAISAGASVVEKGRDTLKHYYDNTEYIMNHAGEHDEDKTGNGTDEIVIKDTNDTGTVSDISTSILYYYNKTFGKNPVVIYRIKTS